jgi:hypothetical protein
MDDDSDRYPVFVKATFILVIFHTYLPSKLMAASKLTPDLATRRAIQKIMRHTNIS